MEDWKSQLLKAAAMLVVVAAEYWAMQPYHPPLLAWLYYYLGRFCYRVAATFGAMGLGFEFKYYTEVA